MVRHPFLVRIFKGSNPFIPKYLQKMLEQFFFYLISLCILICAFLVITLKNPVHSVLLLVLVFLEASFLLILLGIEFLPLIFIIIYVGAIAILFLFVVMMIDIKISTNTSNYLRYFSIGGFIGLFFLFELIYLIQKSNFLSLLSIDLIFFSTYNNWIINFDNLNNLNCLGQFLYTHYFIHFLMSGFLLLIGMIGPIVLTLHNNVNSKNQFIYKQLSRQSSNSTFLTTFYF